MRELNVIEVDAVSGGGTLVDIISGTINGALTGQFTGAVTGGSTTGILGVGLIGAVVGWAVGGAVGTAKGFWNGIVTPPGYATQAFAQTMNLLFDPTEPFPQVQSPLV